MEQRQGAILTAGDRQRLMEPHLESAVIAVLRRMVLDGLKQHPADRPVSPEMVATAWSWANLWSGTGVGANTKPAAV